MTDIDLATVHPRAPAGPPGTEVPGAIFRYWNTEDGPRYGAQRCRRSTPGYAGFVGASQDADPRNERSATARQTQVWLLAIVVLAGLGGVFKRD